MYIFIQAFDYDRWSIIINRLSTPTIIVNGNVTPKFEKDCDDNDKKIAQLNAKAINILYCLLDANKFN